MSIKAISNGQTFNNVTKVTATDGTTTKEVTLSEVGTIATPTATKDITANGTNIDVLNFAKVNVNVPTSSGETSGGVIPHPLACKIVDIAGTESTLDLTDLYSVDNMANIYGVRIDGKGEVAPSNLLGDYAAYAFFFGKSSGRTSIYATKNGNTIDSATGSYYIGQQSDMTGIFDFGTYGKKAMKGKWLFFATAS